MEECNTGLKFNNFVLGKLRSVPSQQHLLSYFFTTKTAKQFLLAKLHAISPVRG